jgi:sulfate-transporting ATPase
MVVALLVIIAVASFSWQSAILASLVAAVIALSVVVVTGFAGQLSLVAAGIAGCSGLAAAQAASRLGFSFLAALIAGAVVATLAGIIVALPALRTRGVNLAIVTLGFGVFISEVLLNNSDYSGGEAGISLPEPKIFGWSIDALQYPGRYAATVAVVFGVLLMLVLNLRRSRSGRQMIAVRDNERAAASVAVNVAATKVKAFGMAAFIAGLGGVLLVFETTTAVFQVGFDNFTSISVLSFVVLGGIGFASGAVFAGTLQIGGVLSELLSGWTSVNEWLPMIGAAALILQLVTFPDGVIPGNIAVVRAIRERIKKRPHSSDNTAGRTNEADEGANKRLVRSVTLEAIDLRVSFGGAVALAGLSFALAPGEIVGLIGPNGAGKTTAIDALTGFVRSTGSVSMGGHEITHLRPSLRSAGGLIRSFQSIELFDDLTVEENLAVACERSRLGSLAYDLVRPGKVSLSDSAYAVVREFQLDGVLQRMPRELSFAQRRLVGIARAIASGPSTLLLDEPAAGLDAHEIHELGRVIHKVARAWGIGILLVEHDLDMVSRTCDRLIVLHHGQTLASGTTADVLSDADVLRAYVGSFGDDGS